MNQNLFCVIGIGILLWASQGLTQVPTAATPGKSSSKPSAQAPATLPATGNTKTSKTDDDCERCNQVPDLTQKFGQKKHTPEELQKALTDFVDAYGKLDVMVVEHDELSEAVTKATVDKDEAKLRELGPKLRKMSTDVHNLYHKTQDLIELAWIADPQNEAVQAYMLFLLASALDEDQYEVAYDMVREMMAQKVHLNEPILYEMAGITSFMMNKFDVARLCFNEALRKDELTTSGSAYKELVPYYIEAWKTEQQLRKSEAEKGDNPRVLLQTSKGNVLVELFEDNAPNTVANFLSLVEKGFYNGNPFHTVIAGFMAQTGSPNADGTGNPGYRIADEFNRPDVRKHFRGSLTMAHTDEPDSGGSQFFISLIPVKHLDGKYTVFGRVVSGMEVISALEKIDTTAGSTETESGVNQADKIIQAKVIRKRNHPYEPQTLPLK